MCYTCSFKCIVGFPLKSSETSANSQPVSLTPQLRLCVWDFSRQFAWSGINGLAAVLTVATHMQCSSGGPLQCSALGALATAVL